MSADTLPDEPAYAFCPAGDSHDGPFQIRIAVEARRRVTAQASRSSRRYRIRVLNRQNTGPSPDTR